MIKFPNNLLCVKSIITIIIVIGFTVLTFLYPKTYEETYKQLATVIVTFYFSHQIDKNNKNGGDDL